MRTDPDKRPDRHLRTQTLVHQVEKAHDARERNTLLRKLMARRNANPYLNRLLHSASSEVKQALLELLETRTARKLADGLIDALRDPDVRVRKAAAQRLGVIKVRKAFDALITLTRDRNPFVSQAALDALAELGNKRAVGAVQACLENRDERVRLAAVNALLQLGERASAVALEKALKDKAPAVRLRAVHALMVLKANSCAQAVAVLANDPHPFVREAAVYALGVLANEHTVPDLVRIARTERDAKLRCVAVEALGRFRDSESAAQLIATLQNAQIEVRCAAAEALSQRRVRGVAKALTAAVECEVDLSAKQHMQACYLSIRQAQQRRGETLTQRQNLLWRDWYSNPGLDAGSLIYTFRPDGTGDVEDFAMGITRGQAAFRYQVKNDRIWFEFSGRRKKMDIAYTIKRSRYRDPLEGLIACLRLEFKQEPYFTRRVPGRSFYYNVLHTKHF